MLLPTIQPSLRTGATHFVGVILDLSTCALAVNLIQSTVTYRAPVAARHLRCGNTLGSSGTRFWKRFIVLTHLPCPMFNGFLSPLSTCSQPSVAWMNTDPSITWHTVVVMPLHRCLNWSTRSSCFPSSPLGQNQVPKHILPIWVMVCHVGPYCRCLTVIWHAAVVFYIPWVSLCHFHCNGSCLHSSAPLESDQVNVSWAFLPKILPNPLLTSLFLSLRIRRE